MFCVSSLVQARLSSLSRNSRRVRSIWGNTTDPSGLGEFLKILLVF